MQPIQDERPPLSPVRAVTAMAAMVALYFFSFFLRTAIPGTIFDELQSDLKLTASSVTALGSIYLYIYAAMQLLVGLLAISTVAAPAGNAAMKELNRPSAVGAAIAMYNGLAYAGVALLVSLSGVVLDLFRGQAVMLDNAVRYPPGAYATLFAVLAGLSVVSLVLTCFIPETHGRPLQEDDFQGANIEPRI
jgi:uncharacterized membrane protein